MANNTGVFFNINDNDGIPLVGVFTDGRVLINHLYGNCLIGSTSATGTASQPLQVTGGAYVSGNADMTPSVTPWMPSEATAAFNCSDSNHSSTNSTAVIGRARMMLSMSFRPMERSLSPSWARGMPSSQVFGLGQVAAWACGKRLRGRRSLWT